MPDAAGSDAIDGATTDGRPPDAFVRDAFVPDAADPNDVALEFNDTKLPSQLGWTFGSDCTVPFPSNGVNLTEGQAASVNAGFLRLDTTGPSSTFVDAYYTRANTVDAARGWAIEARLRVTNVESAPPATEQAFAMFVTVGGENHIIQIGAAAVYTDDNASSAVTTTQFHVYRMRRALQDSTYAVDVDGTQVQTRAPFSANVADNSVTFGDGTCQSRNGAVDVDYVRFTQ